MNHDLFMKALEAAGSALIDNERIRFIAAVRVAQSAAGERPRLVRLLDSAIAEFPSPKSLRILRVAERHPANCASCSR
jgi:hypothetical protein